MPLKIYPVWPVSCPQEFCPLCGEAGSLSKIVNIQMIFKNSKMMALTVNSLDGQENKAFDHRLE